MGHQELPFAPAEDQGDGSFCEDSPESSPVLAKAVEPLVAPFEDAPPVAVQVNLDVVDAPEGDDDQGVSSPEFGDVSPAIAKRLEPRIAPPEVGLSSTMPPFRDTGGAAALLKNVIASSTSWDAHEYSLSTSRQQDGSADLQSFSFTGATMDSEQLQAIVTKKIPHQVQGAACCSSSAASDGMQQLAMLLPHGRDKPARQKRHELFARWDPNSNGVLSLAEVDKGIEELVGNTVPKPAINRAFHAARRLAPPVANYSDDFIDFNEFRLFTVYLQHYLELWHWFAMIDASADRRVSLAEFRQARRLLESWGCRSAFESALADPDSVFDSMDRDGGGLVLFDEFAHWVLTHCGELFDAGHDEDRAEALAMLKSRPANTCAENEEHRLCAVPRAPAHQGMPKQEATSGSLFDKDRLAGLLPGSKDVLAQQRRHAVFRQWDPNGNGILSLAEVDKGVEELVGTAVPKQAIQRAFYAARKMAPPVADYSDDFIDFNEFRLFNIYLRHYLELWHWFSMIDASADRRVSLAEFREARRLLERWGCRDAFQAAVADPKSVFSRMDKDGGGMVLFDEFAHWVLAHCTELFDAGDDKDRAQALALLKCGPPNTCTENVKPVDAVPRPLLHRGVPKIPMKQSSVRPRAPSSARGGIPASTGARAQERGAGGQERARSVSAARSSGPSRVRSGSRSSPNRSRENSVEPRSTAASRGASRGARSRENSMEQQSGVPRASGRSSSTSAPALNATEVRRGRPPKQVSNTSSKAPSRGSSTEPQQRTPCTNRAWASPSTDSRGSPSQCHQLSSTPSPASAHQPADAVTAPASEASGRGSCTGTCGQCSTCIQQGLEGVVRRLEHDEAGHSRSHSATPRTVAPPNPIPRAAPQLSAVTSAHRSQGAHHACNRSNSLPPPRLPPVTSKKQKSAGVVHVMPKIEASRSRLRQHTGCTRARMEAIQKPPAPRRFRQELLGPVAGWRRS